MSTPSMSPGTIAAFGSLEIALLATPPSFRVGERVCTRHRIIAPGAAIGRSDLADVTIHGAPERVGKVSGIHLFLQLTTIGWVIRDDSTNGTHVSTGDGKRVRLNPNQPLRVTDGMTVDLPGQITFRIAHLEQTGGGTELDGESVGDVPVGAWPQDPALAQLLDALIRPHRDGGALPTFNVDWVCDQLGWKPTFAHKRRVELARFPPIRAYLPNPERVTFHELANACERAYPSMVNLPPAPEPGGPPA